MIQSPSTSRPGEHGGGRTIRLPGRLIQPLLPIVVLVAIPSLSWRDIGPLGMILALAMICTGWVFNRLVLRRSQPLRLECLRRTGVSRWCGLQKYGEL